MQPSLFDNSTQTQQSSNQQNKVTEEKIVQPLTHILEEVTPKTKDQHYNPHTPTQSVKKSLDEIFPEQQYYEKNIKKAKEILGDKADAINDEQLQDAVIKIQFLTNSWLDDFERTIFKGLTLQELLHEKGEK